MRLYNTFAALLVRAIVAWCTARKRYVDYVHTTHTGLSQSTQRTYMRRYVIFGYRTGDPQQTGPRAWLPNLYLHHMHAPDADTCLHDHPWPWGLSFVLLGGYVEKRADGRATTKLMRNALRLALEMMAVAGRVPIVSRTHSAPALNWIPGQAFHRVAELTPVCFARGVVGTFTLFLAGPRRKNKPWGYLVPGRGYVDQKTRHLELEASEVRP